MHENSSTTTRPYYLGAHRNEVKDELITKLSVNMYAGYASLRRRHQGDIYYWLFEQSRRKKEKLLIWMSGGPGCSSFVPALSGSGAFFYHKQLGFIKNKNSWNEDAHVVFLEFPLGTGFSRKNSNKIPVNSKELSSDLEDFLDYLFFEYPRLAQLDIYLAGESASGAYIPYLAKGILERNRIKPTYKLSGILLGSPSIDTKTQAESYIAYSKSRKIATGTFLDAAKKNLKQCRDDIKVAGNLITVDSCNEVLTPILEQSTVDSPENCINIYDVRKKDYNAEGMCGMQWPDTMPHINKLFNTAEFRKAFNIKSSDLNSWSECSSEVYDKLLHSNELSSIHMLKELSESIRLAVWSGDQDLVCNYIGIEASLLREFKQEGFLNASTWKSMYMASPGLQKQQITPSSLIAENGNPLNDLQRKVLLKSPGSRFRSSKTKTTVVHTLGVALDNSGLFLPEGKDVDAETVRIFQDAADWPAAPPPVRAPESGGRLTEKAATSLSPFGYTRIVGNLFYARLFNASHMAVVDVPRETALIVKSFLSGDYSKLLLTKDSANTKTPPKSWPSSNNPKVPELSRSPVLESRPSEGHHKNHHHHQPSSTDEVHANGDKESDCVGSLGFGNCFLAASSENQKGLNKFTIIGILLIVAVVIIAALIVFFKRAAKNMRRVIYTQLRPPEQDD